MGSELNNITHIYSIYNTYNNASAICPILSGGDLIYRRLTLYIYIYLTIRLRARDFYEVIVGEGEARINYHFVEIESE